MSCIVLSFLLTEPSTRYANAKDALRPCVALQIVYLFGSLAAYLILLGDVFPSLVGALVSPGSVWSERWVCVLVPALLAVLPLSLTRSLGALSGTAWDRPCLLHPPSVTLWQSQSYLTTLSMHS